MQDVLASACPQLGAYVGAEGLVGPCVHFAQQAHGLDLHAAVDEGHAAGLRQGVLHVVQAVVDGHRVLAGRIAHHAQVGVREQVVDDLDVALEYRLDLVFLLDGLTLVFNARLQVGDVVADGEEAGGDIVLVVDGNEAELVEQFFLALHRLGSPLLGGDAGRCDYLRGIVVVGLGQGKPRLCIQNVAEGDALLQDGFALALEHFAGAVVQVGNDAVLVEDEDAHQGRVEDGPVARGALLGLAFQNLLCIAHKKERQSSDIDRLFQKGVKRLGHRESAVREHPLGFIPDSGIYAKLHRGGFCGASFLRDHVLLLWGGIL